MNTINVMELKPDTYYTADLKIDDLFLLTNVNCPVTNELISALKEWGFKTVQTEGKLSVAKKPDEAAKEKAQKIGPTEDANEMLEEESEEEDTKDQGPSEACNAGVRDALIKARYDLNNPRKSKLEATQAVFDEYVRYIDSVYTHYATHKDLDIEEISATMRALCVFLTDNRRYMLRATPRQEAKDKDFLINHSIRSTIVAITIGIQLNMPLERLTELAIACMLHEIGMLSLPPQLYLNERPLTPSETAKMITHPIIAFNILKAANFSSAIQLGVLDHHERETGTGYPRKIKGEKITLYAKIIAVACSYEAITAPRLFKEARTMFEGLVEILKNSNKQYDDEVVKALLYSVSIYPIGSYVYLSSGKVALVVDATPGSPRYPIIQILGDKDQLGNPRTAQANESDLKILRVMNKKEADDVMKVLASRAKQM